MFELHNDELSVRIAEAMKEKLPKYKRENYHHDEAARTESDIAQEIDMAQVYKGEISVTRKIYPYEGV
jgi:hypothetical protein